MTILFDLEAVFGDVEKGGPATRAGQRDLVSKRARLGEGVNHLYSYLAKSVYAQLNTRETHSFRR